jgi:hypothetical protein
MGPRRWSIAVLAAVLGGGGVLVAPTVAGADGVTSVAATCSGIPIVGSLDTSVDITATDDVDPVVVGGVVKNTISVPVPVGDVPISATITEVKFTVPIPAGVTVDAVSFTPSSFPTQTWTVSGSNLIATLTGSVAIGGGASAPTVPNVQVTTTVGGAPRTVQWKVPTSITAKANAGIFGNFTATCVPTNASTVLVSTTVVAANRAPVAADQTVPVAYETATPVVLAGTDPDANPLTFAVASPPAHGDVTGTPPTVTYTPDSGYSGPDSFTFTVSDGTLTDTGTVTIQVSEEATTVPGAPTIDGVDVLGEGAAKVRWSPPATDGGEPVTGYVVSVSQAGVPTALGTVGAGTEELSTFALANGVPATFSVAAINAVGTGAAATSAPVTTQWFAPWSSGTKAIDELFVWMTAKAPTATERSTWLTQLNAGTKTVGQLIEALRAGTDATTNVDPTIRLYSAYLTRIPDAGGLNFWLGRRRAGWTLSRISSNFAGSSEFIRRYGSLTNRAFVENIYENVLQRPGDAAGISYWTGQLDRNRKSRGQVMINFSESNEYKNKQARNVAATAVYIHVLGKAPTLQQRTDLIAAIDADGLPAAVRPLLRTAAFATRAG